MENCTCTYALEMQTPLGKRRGVLTLNLRGGRVGGELTLFTRSAPIQSGRRSGDNFTFQGEMKTLVGLLPYQANGTLHEDSLEMEIRTVRGLYPVRGVRTEKRRD